MIAAAAAAALDARLMQPPRGFSLDQLMELAGLAVAVAAQRAYPAPQHRTAAVFVGPGNNGGDGLVAARHLKHFGYEPTVVVPRPKERFDALMQQCRDCAIPILAELPAELEPDFVVDAVFGFSFDPSGGVRAPFDAVLEQLAASPAPVLAVDVPSGWDVNEGPLTPGYMPDALISLTAPKPCTQHFAGRAHYVGGRFVPPALAAEFGIEEVMGWYSGSEQVALVPSGGGVGGVGGGA